MSSHTALWGRTTLTSSVQKPAFSRDAHATSVPGVRLNLLLTHYHTIATPSCSPHRLAVAHVCNDCSTAAATGTITSAVGVPTVTVVAMVEVAAAAAGSSSSNRNSSSSSRAATRLGLGMCTFLVASTVITMPPSSARSPCCSSTGASLLQQRLALL